MAETAQKCLYTIENDHFDGEVPVENKAFNRPGQAGTVRLLYTACKAFARRGDQKNGCHGTFSTFIKTFLEENHLLSLPIQPFRGNRFNILFVNAGQVYFFRNKMVEFLQNIPSPNNLLKSVLRDLQEDFFIAGLKALGLISKIVTTPLWNILENKDISIKDMAKRYLDLKIFLQNSLQNMDDILSGEAQLFVDVSVKKDKMYDKLIERNELIDHHVITILSIILPALAKLVEKEFKDHLPGGDYEFVDDMDTRSVEKHNKFPERIFS
jgi:hypothetical protein